MDYFKKRENVEQYKKMIDTYDGTWLINKIEPYLKYGGSILELGMGTGQDFDMLSKKYSVLGTDSSPIFIEDYKLKNPKARVQLLDAMNIDIEEEFDCVFSNKVLQHLSTKDLELSLKQQSNVLKTKGIIFMTLWYGTHREEIMLNGELRFTYYEENDIEKLVPKNLDVLKIERYTELEKDDSLLVVLKRKQ